MGITAGQRTACLKMVQKLAYAIVCSRLLCGWVGLNEAIQDQSVIDICFLRHYRRDDYKFSDTIRQKPLIATLVPNLIGHPYIALERQCISGRTLSKMV